MKIREKQKTVIAIAAVIIIGMCIFPPWVRTFKYRSAYSEEPAGYASIFTPPERRHKSFAHGVELDLKRLCIQILVVLVATGLGLLLNMDGKFDSE